MIDASAGFFAKMERFVDSLERKNKDRDLAVFLIELIEQTEINQKYAEN